MIREKKIAIGVIVFYVVAFPIFVFLTKRMFHNTQLNFRSSRSSLVGRTEDLADSVFLRGQIYPHPILLLCTNHNRSESIVDNALFAAFAGALRAAVQAPDSPLFGIITPYLQDYYSIPPYAAAFRSHVLGGPNNDTTVIQLEMLNDPVSSRALAAMADFITHFTTINAPMTFSIESTSVPDMYGDARHGLVGDLLKVDAITIPVALVLLAICTGTPKMLLLPLLIIPTTVFFAFGLLYPVSKVMQVSSLAPEMAAAVMVAISIDYSLFLASRFRDEARRYHAAGDDSEAARVQVVWRTTVLTAHNVCVSGVTIAMALAGVAILPATFLSAIGVAFVFGALLSVVVSMTLVPAVFLLFFPFFASPPTFLPRVGRALHQLTGKVLRLIGCRRHDDDADHFLNARSTAETLEDPLMADDHSVASEGISRQPPPPRNSSINGVRIQSSLNDHVGAEKDVTNPCGDTNSSKRNSTIYDASESGLNESYISFQRQKQRSSIYFRMAQFTVRHPYWVILAVLAAGSPFIYFCTRLQVDFVLQNDVPRNAPHIKIEKSIQAAVGHGNGFPFHIVLQSHTVGGLLTERFIDATNDLIDTIAASPLSSSIAHVLSFTRIPVEGERKFGAAQSLIDVLIALRVPLGLSPEIDLYKYLFNKTVDATNTTALIAVTCAFDPFSHEALPFLNHLTKILSNFHACHSETFAFVGLSGASAGAWQLMTDVMRRFPIQIGVTFGAIFVFIACVFRSVFVPLRMVVTVAYTVAVAFGAGVLVFQYGWLHPVWPAMEGVVAFSWTVPIFCFSLLCALALDYDIFLLTRVVEMKRLGFRDDAAVVKAVYHTGRVISYAGVIMAITLGSLTFSSVTMLNQYGVICFIATLVDAFVVRPLLVPALMSVAPRVVWWPRRFGVCERDVDDMIESTLAG